MMTRSTRRSREVPRKDEFQILLADINETMCITAVTGKILERLADQFEIDGQELSTSISMGIAIYPDDRHEFDTLPLQVLACHFGLPWSFRTQGEIPWL